MDGIKLEFQQFSENAEPYEYKRATLIQPKFGEVVDPKYQAEK